MDNHPAMMTTDDSGCSRGRSSEAVLQEMPSITKATIQRIQAVITILR